MLRTPIARNLSIKTSAYKQRSRIERVLGRFKDCLRIATRCDRSQMTKLLKISWISPCIVAAIADGLQPTSLTRAGLLEAELPMDWAEQEALFGLAASPQ